jgi:cysteine desulfurase / selenocysteine lyase
MDKRVIYLDNAATTLVKPDCVYDAFTEAAKSFSNMGRGASRMSISTSQAAYEARAELAGLFNIDNPLKVGFTKNATEALNVGIYGLLEKGDHVVTTVCEHNSVLRPLFRMKKDRGVDITLVECSGSGDISPQYIRKAIRNNTRLIVMTHISNVTGTVFDIEEIGRIAGECGAVFFLDATQSAGVWDIDVNAANIDMLAFTGHKYLFSFQGIGGLYVKESIKLKPLLLGGSTSESAELTPEPDMPELTEAGTQNMPGIWSLKKSLEYVRQNSELIQAKEKELTEYFLERIKEISYIKVLGRQTAENRSALFSFISDEYNLHDIAGFLEERYNIVVRVGLQCAPLIHSYIGSEKTGTLRVSMSYFNEKSDIDTLIQGLLDFKAS